MENNENKLSQEEILKISSIEPKSRSIGNLYAKGLYLAGHKPKPSSYTHEKRSFEEIKEELDSLSSQRKKA